MTSRVTAKQYVKNQKLSREQLNKIEELLYTIHGSIHLLNSETIFIIVKL